MSHPRLVAFVLCLSVVAIGQQPSWDWKEYVYKSEGFAITVPSTPSKHPDPQMPGTLNYDVAFDEGVMRIGVIDQHRDCDATLGELKAGALGGKQPGFEKSSLRDLSVAGHPALEFRSTTPNRQTMLQRFVCVTGVFYAFYARWPMGRPKPAAVNRILSSFRLLESVPHQPYQFQAPDQRPDAGAVSGNQYRNEFFGLTFTLPEDTHVAPLPPELARAMDGRMMSSLLFAGAPTKTPGVRSRLISVSAIVATSLWGPDWRQKTGGDYLKRLRTMMPDVRPVGEIKTKQIAGHTFYVADARLESQKPGMKQGVQRNLVTTGKGYVLQFIFEAGTQAELEEIASSMESVVLEFR